MSTQPLQYKMFSTPRKLSDITRRRHGGNPSSEKANAGKPYKEIARQFGIKKSRISQIRDLAGLESRYEGCR